MNETERTCFLCKHSYTEGVGERFKVGSHILELTLTAWLLEPGEEVLLFLCEECLASLSQAYAERITLRKQRKEGRA